MTLFNKNGKMYKELNLKDQINVLEEDKLIELLASNPMLLKRPILTNFKDKVLVGFKEKEYLSL
ncbi:ArsC family protein [Anaerobranca californiensis DSM 14826]|jgi:arsenate reductase|uniref:ArsC family protein n=1 Tax=Anaerobranca californiensis DSM 14826 TaxID=1120989 RepID=A0A1M6MMH2_9FIRM|nr:ArsC family protein [Anaerobranca californiensis DSM 14826]